MKLYQILGSGNAVRFTVLVMFLVMVIRDAETAACEVSMNGQLPYPEPVILDPSVRRQDGFAFKRPELIRNEGKLAFAKGESLRLVCTGSNNHFTSLGRGIRDITVRCISGDIFEYRNTQYPFDRFNCAHDSLSTTRNVVSSSCSGNGLQSIEMGFVLNEREFVKIIDVCFDDVNLDVKWTRFDLLSEIGRQEVGFIRPQTFIDNNFPFKANNFYLRITQRLTISNIIGTAMANRYIQLEGDSYLSRGHLVASGDFLYNIQKLATFNLINVAPQWYLFNEGTWNIAEMETRSYASTNSFNLEVYTGIHGNEQLPDASGREHNLYLHIDRWSRRKTIKAPAVYWKVVYDRRSMRAIVLVGVNNQLKNWETVMATPGVDLCRGNHQRSDVWRICSASNPRDQERGFGYCCEVKDIRNTISFPKFTVKGLLQ